MKTSGLITILLVLSMGVLNAQESTEQASVRKYRAKYVPEQIDNYYFAFYYSSGRKVCNLRNAVASETDSISLFCINPSGSSFAISEKSKQRGSILIYDLWEEDKQLGRIRSKNSVPTAMTFSSDARRLLVAHSNNLLITYNAQTFNPLDTITIAFPINKLASSANNYFVAMAEGKKLCVINSEKRETRLSTTMKATVNDIRFSSDNNLLAVLTSDGILHLYSTSDFKETRAIDALGEALVCDFNRDCKYMAVATSTDRIAVVNIMDPSERHYLNSPKPGMTCIRCVNNNNGMTELFYNNEESINDVTLTTLSPNFTRLLADELNARMTEWMSRGETETLDAYNLRVTDDSRAEQFQLFEHEIVTRMADDIMDHTEITLGGYNETKQQLALKFNTLPEIVVEVPSNEISAFTDPKQLEMRNNVFGLNSMDHFELIYSDIYNKINQKTYVFDNLSRSKLNYISNSEDFVPLSVIQEANAEQMRLEEIKEEIVVAARAQQTITDHTRVDVKTDVQTSTDASGKKIRNYIIDFRYDVEAEYSIQEDFKPGHYKTQESGAASTMLKVMREAFAGEFAKYLVPGKILHMNITGMADASPITGSIAYDGTYGDYVNEPIDKNGELTAVTVTKKTGISSNEALAFVRALGMKNFIFDNIPGFRDMKSDCTYHVQVSNQTGGEFRRIIVQYTFEDAK